MHCYKRFLGGLLGGHPPKIKIKMDQSCLKHLFEKSWNLKHDYLAKLSALIVIVKGGLKRLLPYVKGLRSGPHKVFR